MKARSPHFIKPNAEARIPHHILIVDTEARIIRDGLIEEQTFRLGCAIYLRWNDKTSRWIEKEFELNSLDDWFRLLDDLTDAKRRLLVFAHNASYDYAILKMDTYLSSRNLTILSHVIDTAFIVSAHGQDGSGITFASTTNYYKMSLESLGKIFGNTKLAKPDFDTVSDSELMDYCIQDTRVLATLVKSHIDFIIRHNLGNFKLTIAGQAFGAYRHRFMREQILVHCYDDILTLELASYRGGRCEAFRLGEYDNIFKLDINSMYPYVMRENPFPTKIISRFPIKQSRYLPDDALDSDLYVLADCTFTLTQPAIAVKKDKLLFPIGSIRQTLTNPEIRYLLDNPNIGEIKTIHSYATYEQKNIFREYVDYFYNVRMTTDNDAHRAIAKLFLNSLYGKFGQRSFETSTPVTNQTEIDMVLETMRNVETQSLDWIPDFSEGSQTIRYRLWGNALHKLEYATDKLAYDSCPIIASTVTAYARNYLFDIMRLAGLNNVLYCDTDSVFVTKSGYDNLHNMISQTEIGMLKLEESGNCEIRGAKNYTFNGVMKLKGVKKNAKKLGENHYQQSQFLTKQMRYRDGTPDGIVRVRQIEKHISEDYNKGIVGKDGLIKPFIFADP